MIEYFLSCPDCILDTHLVLARDIVIDRTYFISYFVQVFSGVGSEWLGQTKGFWWVCIRLLELGTILYVPLGRGSVGAVARIRSR